MTAWMMLLLAAAATSPAAATCGTEHNDTMHLQRLRKNLLCQYDRQTGPTVQPNGKVSVKLRFLRTRLDVNEDDNSLTLYGYIMLSWKDEWLTWSPAEYKGVKRVYVDWEEIWTPSVAMVEAPTKVLMAGQALLMNGMVFWSILAPLKAPCLNDPTLWPYDKMVCNVSIGNLSPDKALLEKDPLQMNVIKWKSKGWAMKTVQMKPFEAAGFEDGITLQLTAERRADQHEATTVLPTVAVSLLVLATPWLPADSAHRPLLLGGVILLQICVRYCRRSGLVVMAKELVRTETTVLGLFAQVLMSAVLPLRIRVVGTHAPGVLLLLRDATLLSGLALLQWMLARWLLQGPSHPLWLVALLAPLADLAGRPGVAALLPTTAPPAATENSNNREQPRTAELRSARVAALVDAASFLVMTVVFLGLCVRLLP